MSSPDSPTLIVDVTARRTEPAVVVGVLVAIVVAAALLDRFSMLVLILAVGAATVGIGFHRLGWIGGPRRLTRIVCHADGHWLLCERDGTVRDATLLRTSRITPVGLWLEWTDSASAARSLFLLPWDLHAGDLRRLVVRLRFRDSRMPAGGES